MAFKLDKKFLIHGAAGVAVGALFVFAVSQCSGKEEAEAEGRETMVRATDALNNARQRLDSLMTVNRGLDETVGQQADSIVVLNDSIVVLNDSINSLNEQLVDCREGQRPVAPVKQPRRGNAPVKKPATPCVPCQGKKKDVRPGQPAPRAGAGDAVVTVRDAARNNGTIVVSNGGDVHVNNVVIGGDNNGQIIIANDGVLNDNQQDALRQEKLVRDSVRLVMRRCVLVK